MNVGNQSVSNIIGTKFEFAIFGGGCFWCTEAIFDMVDGVVEATSGYSGGGTENPTYKEVCLGITGHAEVVHVKYNPQIVSYMQLLEIFFKTHDPTSVNRQGGDFGNQYRSIVLYNNTEQKRVVETIIKELDITKIWNKPIVTIVEPFESFYIAEQYHQEYFRNNSKQHYCQIIITPKIEKFEKLFKGKLKK